MKFEVKVTQRWKDKGKMMDYFQSKIVPDILEETGSFSLTACVLAGCKNVIIGVVLALQKRNSLNKYY